MYIFVDIWGTVSCQWFLLYRFEKSVSRHHNHIQQLQLWENTVNVYVLKFIFKAKQKKKNNTD